MAANGATQLPRQNAKMMEVAQCLRNTDSIKKILIPKQLASLALVNKSFAKVDMGKNFTDEEIKRIVISEIENAFYQSDKKLNATLCEYSYDVSGFNIVVYLYKIRDVDSAFRFEGTLNTNEVTVTPNGDANYDDAFKDDLKKILIEKLETLKTSFKEKINFKWFNTYWYDNNMDLPGGWEPNKDLDPLKIIEGSSKTNFINEYNTFITTRYMIDEFNASLGIYINTPSGYKKEIMINSVTDINKLIYYFTKCKIEYYVVRLVRPKVFYINGYMYFINVEIRNYTDSKKDNPYKVLIKEVAEPYNRSRDSFFDFEDDANLGLLGKIYGSFFEGMLDEIKGLFKVIDQLVKSALVTAGGGGRIGKRRGTKSTKSTKGGTKETPKGKTKKEKKKGEEKVGAKAKAIVAKKKTK